MNTGLSGDMPPAENVFLAAEMPGSLVFLSVQLFVETHLQLLGASFGGQGCVDGKDGG